MGIAIVSKHCGQFDTQEEAEQAELEWLQQPIEEV